MPFVSGLFSVVGKNMFLVSMVKIINRLNLRSSRTMAHMALQTTKENHSLSDVNMAIPIVPSRRSILIWLRWNGLTVLISPLVPCKQKISLKKLFHKIIILFRSIQWYSTANSPDAAYIIGGRSTPNLVAEFKDDQWARLDDLNKGRSYHGSITVGTRTMIVGGYWTTWVMIWPYNFSYEDSDFFISIETEVWELENGNNKVMTPILHDYSYGIGLYAIDFNFCSYWIFLILNCLRE